jgi:hypothetical protein
VSLGAILMSHLLRGMEYYYKNVLMYIFLYLKALYRSNSSVIVGSIPGIEIDKAYEDSDDEQDMIINFITVITFTYKNIV